MRRRKSCFEKRLLIREDSVLGKESSIERKSFVRKRDCY